MQRMCQVVSLLFLAMSIYVMTEAQKLTYLTPLGPGAGFFPFWLGLTMAVLTIVWFAQVTFKTVDPIVLPDRSGVVRIVSLLVALILFTTLLNTLGFQVTMFIFLTVILFALGRQNIFVTFAIAFAGSFGVYYIFHNWLHVYLPLSSVGFLENLGL